METISQLLMMVPKLEIISTKPPFEFCPTSKSLIIIKLMTHEQ